MNPSSWHTADSTPVIASSLPGQSWKTKGLQKPRKKNSPWQNTLSMIKRYSSDQIPDVEIEIAMEDKTFRSVSDENGYFKLKKRKITPAIVNGALWKPYTARAVIEDEDSLSEISASSELIVPREENRFGIISDIDDTILVSHSTQTLKKLRLMLLRNAVTRKPFPGASAFYTALHNGYSENEGNPFFYVSSSEWNLYDLLDDFCRFNQFPKGVFMLRELEDGLFRSGRGNHEHKLEKIRMILHAFDPMPFVLIGDNGQKDPEIYLQINREFRGRLIVAYIRHISRRKTKRIDDLSKAMKEGGTDMLLVRDTYEAALDAANRKLIAPSAGKDIRREKYRDTHQGKEPAGQPPDTRHTGRRQPDGVNAG